MCLYMCHVARLGAELQGLSLIHFFLTGPSSEGTADHSHVRTERISRIFPGWSDLCNPSPVAAEEMAEI